MSEYSGKVLLSTLWSQESDGSLVFNAYCPIDPKTSARSIVGCAALMHAQILYYWAEQGADLSLSLASSDAYRTTTRRIYISGEENPTYDYGVFSDINEQLEEVSADTTDDIAALCYACGVLCESDYTSSETSANMTDEVYVRADFDSFNLVSNTEHSLFYDTVTSGRSSTIAITDEGWEIVQDNLLNGLVIAVASSTLGHALVMDGYNAEDGTYHLNFGWGSQSEKTYSSAAGYSTGTGWYTEDEIDKFSIFSLVIDICPDYDGTVFTVTDTREYGVGTLYRILEQAGGIQQATTIDMSALLAGESISLTTALPSVSYGLTVKNLYGDIRIQTASSGMPGGNGTAEAAFSSDTALKVENFAADFASINASSSAIAVKGGESLVVENLNGAVVANTRSTSYAFFSGGSSNITLVNGGIFAGTYTVSIASGESAVTNIFTAFEKFGAEGVSALSSIDSFGSGYAVYSGNGDDTLALTDRSVVLGCVYLAGGNNAITVESGSYLHSYITATAGTLNLTLALKEYSSTALISLVDLTVNNFWGTKVYYGIDALTSALADAIAVDVSRAENGTYTLLSGVSEDSCLELVFDLGNDIQLSLGGIQEYGAYTLAFSEESLTLEVQNTEYLRTITVTANSASKMYDGSVLTDSGYSITQGSLVDGDELVVTVEGSITNAGTAVNKVKECKILRAGQDVTSSYQINTQDGELSVEKRSLVLNSGSGSKGYDGTPLTNGMITVSGSGFAEGEGYTANVTGAQTDVGTSPNTFTYELNDGTLSGNYDIETLEGILLITEADAPQIMASVLDDCTLVSWSPASESEIVDIAICDEASLGEGLVLRTASKSIEMYAVPANYELSLKDVESSVWSEATQIISNATECATAVVSNGNTIPDVFFSNVAGTWSAQYQARHVGSLYDWNGTKECVKLEGKNKIADIFIGSSDTNILFLTDDGNGDALFVDDVYTDFPDIQQTRITEIKEIRAGAGNDIVDMTSQKFEYIGGGLRIRGGLGDDTIWANKGDNLLFGDAGNDRIVGASGDDVLVGGIGNDSMHGGGGNDIFCFCANWGQDTVEQLGGSKVTLWFAEANIITADIDGNAVFTDSKTGSTVTVMDRSVTDVTLKFGDDGSEQYGELVVKGCFMAESSDKVFAQEQKGVLAVV